MNRFSIAIFGLLLLMPFEAFAARQYRCNGYVQYRPCDQPVLNGSGNMGMAAMARTQRNLVAASRDMRAELNIDKSDRYGRIVKQSYKKLSHISGQWRGVVEGNGSLRLVLQILRNGEIESSRFMGEVALRNKQTHFNFVSAPPSGSGWTWKILVFAS